MLRLPLSHARLLHARGVKTWHKDLEAPLKRVGARIDAALQELAALRPKSNEWGVAFAAVRNINAAPSRHLIRPQLVMLGHTEGSGALDSPGLTRFTAGVEMHHLFMLVHDDIMDRGTMRRGFPTLSVALARAKLQLPPAAIAHLATVVGDVLHARSVSLMMEGAAQKGIALRDAAKQQQLAASVNAVLESSYRTAAAQFEDIVGWRTQHNTLSPGDLTSFAREVLLDKGAQHGVIAPLVAGLR